MSSNILSGDELIVSKNAVIGQVLTCANASGKATWQPASGGGGGITTFDIDGANNLRIIDGLGTNTVPTDSIVSDAGGFNETFDISGNNLRLIDNNGTNTLTVPTANIVSDAGVSNVTTFDINANNLRLIDAGGTNTITTDSIVSDAGGFNETFDISGGNLRIHDNNGTNILTVSTAAIVSDGGGIGAGGATIGYIANDNGGTALTSNATLTCEAAGSIAAGYQASAGNTASGHTQCIAIGRQADADTGDNQIAIGYLAAADTGANGVAIGFSSEGTTGAVGVGANGHARGTNSVAVGLASVAAANFSTAVGGQGSDPGDNGSASVDATATRGAAFGSGAIIGATATEATALGSNSEANAPNSIAIGKATVSAPGTNSICIGNGITTSVANSFNCLHRQDATVTTNLAAFVGNELVETTASFQQEVWQYNGGNWQNLRTGATIAYTPAGVSSFNGVVIIERIFFGGVTRIMGTWGVGFTYGGSLSRQTFNITLGMLSENFSSIFQIMGGAGTRNTNGTGTIREVYIEAGVGSKNIVITEEDTSSTTVRLTASGSIQQTQVSA